MRKQLWVVKTAESPGVFQIINKGVNVCKDTTNTSYTWGCYHMITNHTIYIHRGTTSTVYFICKSRRNKTELTSVDTRTSRMPRPMNQKSNNS